MSSQRLALASSRLRNHLRVALVRVFWNIWASSSSIAPRGCMALIYIFKWDLGSQSRQSCPRLASWIWEAISHQGKVRVIGSPWGLPSCEPWNCCTVRFMSSLNWIWLATIVFSSSWVFMGSSVFGCFPPFVIVLGSSDFLWLGLSYRSNIGLWCCSNEVSSMLTSFNTVMGVMGLELELLA